MADPVCRFADARNFCASTFRSSSFAENCAYRDDRLTLDFVIKIVAQEWREEPPAVKALLYIGVPIFLLATMANGLSYVALRNERRMGKLVAIPMALIMADIVSTLVTMVFGIAFFLLYPFFYQPACFHPAITRGFLSLDALSKSCAFSSLLMLTAFTLCCLRSTLSGRSPSHALRLRRTAVLGGLSFFVGTAVAYPLTVRGVHYDMDGYDLYSSFCGVFGSNVTDDFDPKTNNWTSGGGLSNHSSANHSHTDLRLHWEAKRAVLSAILTSDTYNQSFLEMVYLLQMLTKKTITFMAPVNGSWVVNRVETPKGQPVTPTQCSQLVYEHDTYVALYLGVLLVLIGATFALLTFQKRKTRLLIEAFALAQETQERRLRDYEADWKDKYKRTESNDSPLTVVEDLEPAAARRSLQLDPALWAGTQDTLHVARRATEGFGALRKRSQTESHSRDRREDRTTEKEKGDSQDNDSGEDKGGTLDSLPTMDSSAAAPSYLIQVEEIAKADASLMRILLLEFSLVVVGSLTLFLSMLQSHFANTGAKELKLTIELVSALAFLLQISLNFFYFMATSESFRREVHRLTTEKLAKHVKALCKFARLSD